MMGAENTHTNINCLDILEGAPTYVVGGGYSNAQDLMTTGSGAPILVALKDDGSTLDYHFTVELDLSTTTGITNCNIDRYDPT